MPRKVLGILDLNGGLTVAGAAGTSGQVLTSAGAGAAPAWTTVSGGAVPTGGTAGQVLSKIDATNFNTQWTTPTTGTTVYRSPAKLSASTATTESAIASVTIPANGLTVNSTIKVTVYGTRTGTTSGSATVRIRIGTTTLTGVIVATNTSAASATASPFAFDGAASVTAVGTTGTIGGGIRSQYGTTMLVTVTAPLTVNTATATLVELTFQQSVANTMNIYGGYLEVIL